MQGAQRYRRLKQKVKRNINSTRTLRRNPRKDSESNEENKFQKDHTGLL